MPKAKPVPADGRKIGQFDGGQQEDEKLLGGKAILAIFRAGMSITGMQHCSVNGFISHINHQAV